MSKQKWEVKSRSYPLADTGDYDGYWEVVNEKGQSITTTEDYDDIEKDLQKIADALNSFEGQLRIETALEINLHCDNQMLKMENERWQAENSKMRKALEEIQLIVATESREELNITGLLSLATEALKTNTDG